MPRYDDIPYWQLETEKSESEQALRALGFTTQNYHGYEYIIIGSINAPKIFITCRFITPEVKKLLHHVACAQTNKTNNTENNNLIKEVLLNYTLIILTQTPSYLVTPHKFESYVSNEMGGLAATVNIENDTFDLEDFNGRLENRIYLKAEELLAFFKNQHDNDTT